MALKLTSNRHLYEYLLELSAKLRVAGVPQLGEITMAAARQSGTFPATEFLGESRIALRRILEMDAGGLTEGDRRDMRDVLSQLDDAFNKRK